jgi:hypothetical protein
MACKCAPADYVLERECPLSRSAGSIATVESLQESHMLEHWMPLRLVAAAEARELLGCGQKGLAWQAEVQRKGVASYERRVTRTHRGAMETTNEAARRVRDGRSARACAEAPQQQNRTNRYRIPVSHKPLLLF